ncbi:MAG TPA: hypothetical protein VJ476_15505 [Rhizomicrobium sp.]|nr:hypothetical protein [Rhizomicrobium sp.]
MSASTAPDLWSSVAHAGLILSIVEAGAVTAAAALTFLTLNTWRIQNRGKRKAEIAEQAMMDFYDAVERLSLMRRRLVGDEEATQLLTFEKKRSPYYNKYLLVGDPRGSLISTIGQRRALFRIYFGATAVAPFDKLTNLAIELRNAGQALFTGSNAVEGDEGVRRLALLSELGWADAPRPDAMDRAIGSAFAELEALCKPILDGRRS